ncbi:YidH family protein [Agromyces sp. Marseille-Q5079]|uniref:YidH family protein n=1 Tax=Agromyces sp. Marseille-Q5079 TaxID=3439059 RepID=UPI003D9C9753
MPQPQWRREGEEPDYRFTLANERTFLAWIRTALALLAGGVLLFEFAPSIGPRGLVLVLAVGLAVVAAVLGGLSYVRWRANEIAMRHGRPLPGSIVIPILAAVALLSGAVIAIMILTA